jgi:FkbM family methyltransferase
MEVDESSLILDVGMNVGHASLYFAQRTPKAVIVGFELLKPTSARAAKNLALNPKLACRIKIREFGLAAQDGEFTVQYNEAVPGRVGLFNLPEDINSSNISLERALVRDSLVAFDEVLAQYPRRKVVMKIDCEGAEYQILERLGEAGRLERVSIMMIEWHRREVGQNPNALREYLSSKGFICLLHGASTAPAGMLYATRIGETALVATDLADQPVAG